MESRSNVILDIHSAAVRFSFDLSRFASIPSPESNMNVLRKASLNPSASMKRSSSAQSAATNTSSASQVISPADLDKQLNLNSPPATANSRRELEDLSQRPGESPLATTAFDQPGSPLPQAAAVESPGDASSSSSSSSEYASVIDKSEDTSAEASPSTKPPPITSLAAPSTLHLTSANVPSSEAELLKDLELVKQVLDLFLNSRMRDGEHFVSTASSSFLLADLLSFV